MKKIINEPEAFVQEMLEGLYKAYPEQLTYADDIHSLVYAKAPVEGKVGLMTGGGSGHLPVFLGYVGENMLDGCAVGDVFQSPSAEQILNVIQRIDSSKGVVFIYGNYGGDIMNFDMAGELAEMDDIETRTVVVADDVASAPKENAENRRGVAGMVFAYKIAGAKAAQGASIDEVVEVTNRALQHIRSMGVALSPVTIPAVGEPSFEIGEDEMEIGMGIHGEPGMKRETIQPADQITERMTDAILADMEAKEGERIAVMVNSLGGTPPEELLIMFRKVYDIFSERGIEIYRTYIGEFATSMEMKGASLTFFRVADDELAELLDMPSYTPFFKQV